MGSTGFMVPNDTVRETGERRTLSYADLQEEAQYLQKAGFVLLFEENV